MLFRMVTGMLLIGVGIFTITYGGMALFGWTLLIGMMVIWELSHMSGITKTHKYLAGLGCGIMILVMMTCLGDYPMWRSLWMMIGILGLLVWASIELILKKVFFSTIPWVVFIRIVSWTILTVPFIYLLREGKQGLLVMWFACLNIWAVDICAFFGGKWIGKHKIAAQISPHKTIEGSIMGLIGCMAVSWIYISVFNLNSYVFFFLALVIGVISQVGDFHESLVKRHFKVKDSSQMLPGHGGFYDRADSSMLVMPLIYFFFNGSL